MRAERPLPKHIKDVFYETRVLMGRQYTVRRFATEVLGRAVDPVMLSYIEKGKRFPSEALVRKLAAIRKQDPRELLVLLWRDRILHAFGKELRRVLSSPREADGLADAELAVRVSRAIAALPDDGSWIPLARWRQAFTEQKKGAKRTSKAGDRKDWRKEVEALLRERGLVEVQGTRVRRRGRHYVAQEKEERAALAMEFCTLFAKALLDKLALPEQPVNTYLRNHFLHLERERFSEFSSRLDTALRELAEEFAADAGPGTGFVNVLVAATEL